MNYTDYTLVELRQLAKERGAKNVSKLKREELIDFLKEREINISEPSLQDNSIDNDEGTEIEEEMDSNRVEEFNSMGYKLTNNGDKIAEGILEVLPDGYGFLRGDNYLSTADDVYVSPVQIRRFRLDNGDKITGIARMPKEGEKFPALIFVGKVNGDSPEFAYKRKKFDDLTPIHPNERIHLETTPTEYAMRKSTQIFLRIIILCL